MLESANTRVCYHRLMFLSFSIHLLYIRLNFCICFICVSGEIYLTNAYNSSLLFVNPDIPETRSLKQKWDHRFLCVLLFFLITSLIYPFFIHLGFLVLIIQLVWNNFTKIKFSSRKRAIDGRGSILNHPRNETLW